MIIGAPFWISGISLSILSQIFIFFTYFKFRIFRQHPNNLVILRTLFDLVFCLLLFQILGGDEKTECNTPQASLYSFLAQVSALGSELCFLVIGFDMALSVVNPFTDFKTNSSRYRIFIFLVSVASGVALVAIPKAHGLSVLGICWTSANLKELNTMGPTGFNPFSWGFFFIPIILIYALCIFALFFSRRRLLNGLPTSFEAHKSVIFMSLRFVVGYALYWTVAAALYAAMYWKNINFVDGAEDSSQFLLPCLAFVLGGKTLVTTGVWIWNARKFIVTDWNADVEGKTRAELNQNLRGEILKLTTEGIRSAVALADLLPPSSSHQPTVLVRGAAGVYSDPRRRIRISFNSENQVCLSVPPGSQHVTNRSTVFATGNETPLNTKLPAAVVVDEESTPDAGVNKGVATTTPARPSLTKAWIHPSSDGDIVFTDFRPTDFREMREMCGITCDSYDSSLRRSAKERFSEGASGAFLYFSHDSRFIVKTTTKAECDLLCRILDKYKNHFATNPNSLITKFFGCHMIQMYTTQVYFLVMENVFITDLPIHERYDLKGSWVARNASAVAKGQKKDCRHCLQRFTVGDDIRCEQRPNRPCVPNVVLKDNDLNARVHLPPDVAETITRQLFKDAEFLSGCGIMDYSLLMGVHRQQQIIRTTSFSLSEDAPVHRRMCGGVSASVVEGPGVYFFGIIDILQEWNFEKKMERAAKCILGFKNRDGISAIEPKKYFHRFHERVISAVFRNRDDDLSSTDVSLKSALRSLPPIAAAATLKEPLLRDTD